jgi:phosphoribosyl-dephospho-CoA transferase
MFLVVDKEKNTIFEFKRLKFEIFQNENLVTISFKELGKDTTVYERVFEFENEDIAKRFKHTFWNRFEMLAYNQTGKEILNITDIETFFKEKIK